MLSKTSVNKAMKLGVKGSDVYESTGDPRVDLSVALVRGCDDETIYNGLTSILSMPDKDALEDAILLAFQTRNIRGGKGERQLFKKMMLYFYDAFGSLFTPEFLELFPRYGCWDDLFQLATDKQTSESLRYGILVLTKNQLEQDVQSLEQGKSVSLCAKWCPREDRMGDLYKQLAKMMYPEIKKLSERHKTLRQTLSKLNVAAKTTEIKMCANTWADIVPKEVPAVCRQKHMKAFLNENKRGASESEDRMVCREHFQEFFAKAAAGEVKMNGAETIYPHEVVSRILHLLGNENSFPDEKNALIGQWLAIVNKAKEGGALQNCIAMCDFSGSMSGLPKLICTALGLLVAEVNGTNKILTFDSEPKWHTFPEGDIFQKVASISDELGQGLSTDFQKAMDLVLSDIVKQRIRPEDVPKDLIVFTDMGWDQACGSDKRSGYTGNRYRHNVKTEEVQTHIEMIREAFRRTGEDMWSVPFVPPRIVIWNLRANYKDFHATSDEEGVVMLSGWSPSLFKVLQEKGVEVMTPYQALRAQLDDPMYDAVRVVIREWRRKLENIWNSQEGAGAMESECPCSSCKGYE